MWERAGKGWGCGDGSKRPLGSRRLVVVFAVWVVVRARVVGRRRRRMVGRVRVDICGGGGCGVSE